MATASAIEIKRAEEAAQAATELRALNKKLDRILALLEDAEQPAEKRAARSTHATRKD